MINFVTSFSEAGYTSYARRMLESVKEFWGEGIHLTAFYHDFDLKDYDYPKSKNITYRNLNDIEDLHTFRESNKENDGTMGGKVKYNWRLDAIKFCHKVFGMTELAFEMSEKSTTPGWLIWLDADTYTTKKINAETFKYHLNPKAELIYMDRKSFDFAETSFMAFNLNFQPPLDLLGDLRGYYMSGEVTNYREWHDGFIISRIIKLYIAHGLRCIDLTGHLDTIKSHLKGPQAFDSSFLGQIMIHHKGEKKYTQLGNPDHRSTQRYKKLGEIIEHYSPSNIIEVGEWDSHRAIGTCTKAFKNKDEVHYTLVNSFSDVNFRKTKKLFESYQKERKEKNKKFTFELIKGTLKKKHIDNVDYAFIGGFNTGKEFTNCFNKLKEVPLVVIDKVYTPDNKGNTPDEEYMRPVKVLEKYKTKKKYILPSEDEISGGGRCHIAVVINSPDIKELPREILQVPIIVNPKDCVPKDDIMGNVKQNMNLLTKWVDKGRGTHDAAIIVSAGPSTDWKELSDVVKDEKEKGFTPRIACVKHSYPKLLKNGFDPWGCIILDPRSLDGVSTHGIVRRTLFDNVSDKTMFFVASMTEPSVTKFLLDKKLDVWGWHAFSQALQRNIEEEHKQQKQGAVELENSLGIPEGSTLITGGTCAAMRSVGLMHTLGFRRFHLFGFDCNIDEPDTKKQKEKEEETGQPKFMQVSVDNKSYWTTGELLAMAQDCEKLFEREDVDMDIIFHGKDTLVSALWNKSKNQNKKTYKEILKIEE
jgi:hypothetical protein